MWSTTFDARNPHVQFFERDLETEDMVSYSDTGNRKGRQTGYAAPNPTAPDLDSTIETVDSADFTDFARVIGDERTNLFVTNERGNLTIFLVLPQLWSRQLKLGAFQQNRPYFNGVTVLKKGVPFRDLDGFFKAVRVNEP